MLFGTEGKVSDHGDDTHVQPTGVTRGGDGNEAASFEAVSDGFLACAGATEWQWITTCERVTEQAWTAEERETSGSSADATTGKGILEERWTAEDSDEAAAKKVVRKPLGTVEEREARRRAVLAIVPAKLRKKFSKGCSSCRHRAFCTVSCWAKRGFIAS